MVPVLLSLLLRALPATEPAPAPPPPAPSWAQGDRDKHRDGGHKKDDEEREEDLRALPGLR